MSTADVAAIVGAVATGGVAISAGLYKLGNTLGNLTKAVQGFESRLEILEDQFISRPRGRHVAHYEAPYSSPPGMAWDHSSFEDD